MKKINTLFAVILSRPAEAKRSINKIIAIKYEGGDLATDEDEIQGIFGETGQIITFQTFQGKNETLLNVGDLVEIPVMTIKSAEADGHLVRVDHGPMIKRGCYEVIEIPYSLFVEDCFKLDEVNKILAGKDFRFGSSEFYLSIADQIYGSFKLVNGKIEPKLGKDVVVFNFDPENLMSYQEDNYLLERPNTVIGRGDCMSSTQLMEWLKDKIKHHGNYNGDVNKIIKLLQKTVSADGELDRIRFRRALTVLENIELSMNDIEQLFSETSTWNHIFQECFEKNETEFRNKHLANLAEEFKLISAEQILKSTELNRAIADNERRVDEQLKQVEGLEHLLIEKNNELKMIDQRREELILNIKLQAKVTGDPIHLPLQKTIQQNYEIQELISGVQNYFETIDDYLEELKSNWGYTAEKRRLFETSLFSLFQCRFLLSDNVSFALSLIRSLGNARICLQQAEVDWIKFGDLYLRGLDSMIESSETNPALPHYYLLQDFNLPSFECYGKPLIDLANGIRVMVPGTQRLWPTNLSLVLIPLAVVDSELGFRINIQIFKNWVALPYAGEMEFGSKGKLTAQVDLAAFSDSYEKRHQGNIEDYIR